VRVAARMVRAGAGIALALGAPALLTGQSPAVGHWEGVARVPGQGALKVEITLDSTGTGWQGSLRVPARRAEPFAFAAVERLQDSLILRLPAEAQGAVFRLAVSADGQQLGGTIQAGASGNVLLARAGSAAAAATSSTAARRAAVRRGADDGSNDRSGMADLW